MQWHVGIDEAGRGALAGPVCVGAVLYPKDFDWREGFSLITRRGLPKIRDSKQLSAQQRGILYDYIAASAKLRHAYALVNAEAIDTIGIVNAVHEAAALALAQLGTRPDKARVLCDAGIRVPGKWEQQSFIKGDERIPAIAFASIIAKVTRDRHMEELSFEHSIYGFEAHKGYGTDAHRLAIRKHGLVPFIHRKTFTTAFT